MSTELTAPTKVEVKVDPIATALVAAGVTSARIEQLSKYDELLVLPDPTTQEEADVFKLAQFECRDLRNAAVSTLKALRDPHIRMQKLIVGEENRIVATIDKYEGPLKTKRDAYAKLLEQRMAEDVARHKAKNDARKERMATVGFRFNPLSKEYELPGFASIDEEGVSGINVDDLQFAEWLLDLEKQVAEHREREEEKERTAKIAADALAKEQEAKELAAKLEAERIAAAEAEIERKQNELYAREKQMNARVNEGRKNELIAAGMTLDDPDDGLPFGPSLVLVDMCLPVHELFAMTDEQYAKALVEAREQKAELDEYNRQREEEARAQRAIEEQERAAREKQLQEEAAKKAVEDERIRVATEMKARLEKEELQAKEGAEKLAAAGDKGLVEQYIERLKDLHDTIPVLTSSIGRSAMKTLDKQLSDTKGMLTSLLKDL